MTHPTHFYQFSILVKSKCHQYYALEIWLGLLEESETDEISSYTSAVQPDKSEDSRKDDGAKVNHKESNTADEVLYSEKEGE